MQASSGTTLTIDGAGSLDATGGKNSAGIGGGYNRNPTYAPKDGGEITISGGTIKAIGGYGSAGIGGGYAGDSGTVTICGGSLNATGGTWSISSTYSVSYSTLLYSTEYTVTVSGFADILGNVMDENSNNSFTTKSKPSSSSGSSANKDEDKEEITISDDEGNTMNGTIEETEDGKKIEISRDDFDELADISNGNVTFDTAIATLIFSSDAVDTISGASDTGDISLTVETVDTSTLSDEAQEIVGDRTVYDITLMAGDTQISELGGTATITVSYEISDDEDPDAIVVCYIDDDGNLTPIRGRYDAETGTVVFTVTHFSQYAVGYNKVTFSDVSNTDWYYDAVTFCAAREITTGTGEDTFSPDLTLTRGQFLVMLMRAYGIEPDDNSADNFDDAGDTYYTGYLAATKRLGISNGVGNNLFAPESQITRQDMFTLLCRALDVVEELPETDGSACLSDFNDVDEISDYAKEAMATFVGAGIVVGYDETLDPLGGSTRAQMAQVLYNLLAE